MTIVFDHLVRTPGDRFKNQNRDAWSHNDAWTHNQTATKILAFHEINPEGKTKEIESREFMNSHNGKLFFSNQEIEYDQMEFLEDIVTFIGQRLSRYDTEYMLKKALEGDETKDLDSLMQGKMLAKELMVLAKFTTELEKCGVVLIFYATGKIQLGQWLRSFDLLRRKVPDFIMGWSLRKILEEPISYTQMIGLPEKEMVEIGTYFEKPVIFISPNRATNEFRDCNVINITILKDKIAGKSHIWECCTPPSRLGGISTIWEKLAEIGNVKAKFNPVGRAESDSQNWVFNDGYSVELRGAILNHRQRIYVAAHLLNSENFAPFVGETEILVPADPNGSWANSATKIRVGIVNAYPLHNEIEGKANFCGAKEAMAELSAKLITRLDTTKAVEYCGITPFESLGIRFRLRNHKIKCFKAREFDSEICFKSQSGKLTQNIPRDMAKDIAAKKFNQLSDKVGYSRNQGPSFESDSVKINRALLTKGVNCAEWKQAKHRKLNPICLNAQMEDSKKLSSKQGKNLNNY